MIRPVNENERIQLNAMARAGIGRVLRVRANWTLQPTEVSNVIVQRARTARKECATSKIFKTATRRVPRIWAAIAAAATAAVAVSGAAAAGGGDSSSSYKRKQLDGTCLLYCERSRGMALPCRRAASLFL
jgi:hypothetical protein